MARASIKQLRRFRTSILSNPTLIYPKPYLNPSYPLSSSSNLINLSSTHKTFSRYDENLKLLKKCVNLSHLYQIQAQLITSGLFQNLFLAGGLLNQIIDSGCVDYAILTFQCINSPDTLCVNAAIKAYACSSGPHQAVVFYFKMLDNGFIPNSFTFSPLISFCAKAGCSELGRKCHGQVIKNGVDDVLQVQNSLIHMYGSCGVFDVAIKVFHEMPVRDLVSWNSILKVIVESGNLESAHELFDVLPVKNLVTWNIVIAGYLSSGNPGNALKLFRKMTGIGVRCNDKIMVTVLTACGRSARMKEGRSVHGSLVKTLTDFSLIIDTALVNMYSRCKRANVARIIFDRMQTKNLLTWNAMVLGHCINGNPEDGLRLYSEMVGKSKLQIAEKQEGERVLPDEITFVGVYCACARKGLLVEGRNYFSQMTDVFKVKPTFAHYWCMANIHASVGLMQEAMDTLKNMSVEANISLESSMWAKILGSCRFEGDVALGERIAVALIEEDPQNESYYALLLNVYSVAGRWEDVDRIKDMMKERGVTKVPGSTLVDLNETVHGLKVGDRLQQLLQGIG